MLNHYILIFHDDRLMMIMMWVNLIFSTTRRLFISLDGLEARSSSWGKSRANFHQANYEQGSSRGTFPVHTQFFFNIGSLPISLLHSTLDSEHIG